jgi:hypothetical protein
MISEPAPNVVPVAVGSSVVELTVPPHSGLLVTDADASVCIASTVSAATATRETVLQELVSEIALIRIRDPEYVNEIRFAM